MREDDVRRLNEVRDNVYEIEVFWFDIVKGNLLIDERKFDFEDLLQKNLLSD